MKYRILKWLVGWVELGCIFVYLITFGYYRPWLDFTLIAKLSKWKVRSRNKQDKNK